MAEAATTLLRLAPGRLAFYSDKHSVVLSAAGRQVQEIPYGFPLEEILPALRSGAVIEVRGLVDIEKGQWIPLQADSTPAVGEEEAQAVSPSIAEEEPEAEGPVPGEAKHARVKKRGK